MTAYYNEIDAYCAAWLRNLIAEGLIAPGDVDERDIRDVRPDELRGYTQCHFFAGIGVWSYALRLAGWPDDRPVWTGSCPCQPFSAAGKRGGAADERHLWPHWNHLVGVCRPPVVFGEQVASKDGLGWLDLVQADLEGAGYAFGASDLCAAGCGAPHIRQRLWFVAEGVADAADGGREPRTGHEGICRTDDGAGTAAEQLRAACPQDRHGPACPTDGFWRGADWLLCRDGKWRPVEALPQPLADGSAESLGRVRSEVVAQAEEAVDACAMEAQSEPAALLRDLCRTLGQAAPRLWPAGRLPGLHEAPFLLAFLRQLSTQGWRFAESCPLPRPEAAGVGLRGLRDDGAATSAPHQRGLEGRAAGEHPDPLHLLSSLLARAAQEAWGRAHEAHAEVGFPLGHNAPARVGRLRAYGNAIVAEVAAEFVRAYLERDALDLTPEPTSLLEIMEAAA